MISVKTILVPTDFSSNAQAAFDAAYDLAAQLGAQLYALHVQDESTLRVALQEGLLESTSSQVEVESEIHKLTRMRFSSQVAGKEPSTVEIKQLSRRGDAEAEIIRYANEIHADMIVIGMRGVTAWSDLASFVLGSVAESVLRNAPCPVRSFAQRIEQLSSKRFCRGDFCKIPKSYAPPNAPTTPPKTCLTKPPIASSITRFKLWRLPLVSAHCLGV
jgi:universal stress protein A